MVRYTFIHLNTEEIIGFNQMMKDIYYFVPDEFTFEGELWEFLHLYSMQCCDTNSNAYNDMDMINYSASYPEGEFRPDYVQGIIDIGEGYCN